MFRWCSHTWGKPGPPSLLRPADCACLATKFLSACRPLCCMPVSSEFSKSFLPSGSGPVGCQSRSARAKAQLCLPTDPLPLAEPPARGWMQTRWEPQEGAAATLELQVLPLSPQHATSLAWGCHITLSPAQPVSQPSFTGRLWQLCFPWHANMLR